MSQLNAAMSTSTPTSPKREAAASSDGGSIGGGGAAAGGVGQMQSGVGGTRGTQQQIVKEIELLEPPNNFSLVEEGLYRSSLPTSKNFSFVRRLGLKTIIILTYEKPNKTVINFLKQQNIRIMHIDIYNKEKQTIINGLWKPLSEQTIKESIELILNDQHYPLLISDMNGIYHIGIIIGCLRKLQHWNLTSVINEYRSFLSNTLKNNKYVTSRYINEQFIELFDVDLINIPQCIPKWFENYIDMEANEKSRLEYLIQNHQVDDCGTLIYQNQNQNHQNQQQLSNLSTLSTVTCSPPSPSPNTTTNTTPTTHSSTDINSNSNPAPQQATPKYVVYYFSSASPLNSEASRKKPRIETF